MALIIPGGLGNAYDVPHVLREKLTHAGEVMCDLCWRIQNRIQFIANIRKVLRGRKSHPRAFLHVCGSLVNEARQAFLLFLCVGARVSLL